MKKLFDKIDWGLLQKQKLELQKKSEGKEFADIVHLIDSLQDTAVEDYGYPWSKIFPHNKLTSDTICKINGTAVVCYSSTFTVASILNKIAEDPDMLEDIFQRIGCDMLQEKEDD